MGAARGALAACVAAGAATAAVVVAQATLLAHIVTAAFQRGATLGDLRGAMAALLLLAVVRGILVWAAEVSGHRAAAGVIARLRQRLLRHVVALGPVHLGGERTGELATTATEGLDALDGYFARYLPQLGLAVVVPPAAIAWVLHLDVVAAITLAVTLPLLPLFMALVGLAARQRTEARWRALARLGAHFLDVVQGLPTLRVFGRAAAQEARIREVTDAYRRTTMETLRVAFLSALVLETLTTLGTALVAVGIGVRLVDGGIDLESGLAVLVLAPEVYLPLRQLGVHFHASMDGLSAVARAHDLLDVMPPGGAAADGTFGVPDLRSATVRFEAVTFTYPEREQAAIRDLDLELRPGETTVLEGPSGAGKSTVAALLLRFTEPQGGRITVGGTDLRRIRVDAWRRAIAWVPQRAHLVRATVADNIRMGSPGAAPEAVRAAAREAGAGDFIEALPHGYDTLLGENGVTLSAGQRQRVALARALLRDAPLLVLDEPGSNLDAESRALLRDAVERAGRGRTVLVLGHSGAAPARADRVVRLAAPA